MKFHIVGDIKFGGEVDFAIKMFKIGIKLAVCQFTRLLFYGHFCANGRLNGSNDLQECRGEVKTEKLFIYTDGPGFDRRC